MRISIRPLLEIKLDEKVVLILQEPMPIAFQVCSLYGEEPFTGVYFTPLYYDSAKNKLEPSQGLKYSIHRDLFQVGEGCFKVNVLDDINVPGRLDVQAWIVNGSETAYTYVYVRNFTDEIVLETPPELSSPMKVRCLVDIYKYTNAITFEFGGNEVTVLAAKDGYVWSASITLRTVDYVISCKAKSRDINGGFIEKKVNLMKQFNDPPIENAMFNITLFVRENVLLNCTPRDRSVSWYKNGRSLKHEEGTLTLTLERKENFAVIACFTKIRGKERSTTWYIQVRPQFQWYPTGVLIFFGAIGTLLGLLIPLSYLKSSQRRKMKGDHQGTEMEAVTPAQEHVLQIPPEYEFSKEILRFRRKIADGVFGVIMMAKAVAIVPREPSTAVAVHIVANVECDSVMHVLIAELKMMIEVGQHLNIVNFLGAITETVRMGDLMVMYEYCPYGTLQEFLWQNRANFISRPLARWFYLPDDETPEMLQSYTTQDLHCFASQIANGMAYLISRRILHGSLRARKIMLCEKRVVKICGFGLTRTVFRSSASKRAEDETTAHKWLALESFPKLVFNANTDVWAFGVVLWEIFSLGATPYADMSSAQILHQKLLDGYRLEKPEHTNRELYDIMLSCWYVNPTLRPTFERLTHEFHRLLSHRIRDFYNSLNKRYMRANERRIARQEGRTPEEDDDDFPEPVDNNHYVRG
ncbi:vascular endothelial growth factor receptor 2-like [Anopheles ziemanni]|uniref:vascular endothelial growth factor receptor 2-like n=1 Tax=Anopheles coustani TaxID=139045 RepID=UPI0026593389|nr:vascular endothelial growth factor receptor 2-like [Anopheles coustani]XP_058169135.1 vascular endothelial growth factor receptor 2-like [Anopheles ziemanni]